VTIDEARQLPTVLSVEHAGRLLGLGRSASYEAARRGELPTLKFGRRLLVPTGKVLELLGLDPALLAAVGTPRGGGRRGAA
jgi:excisionase family DNA binding protein